MNNNVYSLVQVFGIFSASTTEILQSCAEPAVWKYQLFNFLSLQCLSWYNLVTTLHPIISYSFWNNRQGAHKPYRVCCSRCSYISWLCLHYETCDITGVTSNLWVWLHNAILFPHPMFWLLCLHVVCLFLSLCIFVLYEAIMIIWICISIWILNANWWFRIFVSRFKYQDSS